jgi:hypothetical protein
MEDTMHRSAKAAGIALSGLLLAAAVSVALLVTDGSRVQAQTPPAPCACSRSTPIIGADDISAVPGQLAPRYGVIHCQCGTATCVSQVAYGSVGIPQLYCVK